MNKQLILTVICGFISGSCFGSLLAIKHLDSYYESISDNEIEKAREYYKGLNNKKNISSTITKLYSDDLESAIEITENNGYRFVGHEPEVVNVGDTITFDDILDEEEETTEMDYVDLEEVEDSKTNPYVITEEEFSSECLHYDKISATYYADGTLADEDEEILDIESTIGFEALDSFVDTDESEPIFVRNDNLNIDYSVNQSKFSYSEYVYGVGEQDESKVKRSKEWTD